MTHPLPRLSPRPEFIVDAWTFMLYDPVSQTYVGRSGPFGRERVVAAMPMRNAPPQPLVRARVFTDAWGIALADPQDNLVGTAGVIINRVLPAQWTEDTRRVN